MKYLIFSDLKSAQARSAQQATALGCDGANTLWWWPVVELKDGTAAVMIGDGVFDAQTANKIKSSGLDMGEQNTLRQEKDVATILPDVHVIVPAKADSPDVLLSPQPLTE